MRETARGPGRTKVVSAARPRRRAAGEACLLSFAIRHPWLHAARYNAIVQMLIFAVRYWIHGQSLSESLTLTVWPGVACFLLIGSVNLLSARRAGRQRASAPA